jgi:hypothetical protein
VGFSGVGGNDYLTGSGGEQNCISIENGNVPVLGRALDLVLKALEKDRFCYDEIIRNGIKTAKRYQDFNEEGESLSAFFKTLSCFPAGQTDTSVLDFAQSL